MIRTVTGSIIILLCMSLCCIYFYSEMPSQNLICGYITNEVRQGDTTEYIVSLKTKDGIIDGVKAQQIDVAAKQYKYCTENKNADGTYIVLFVFMLFVLILYTLRVLFFGY
jgi:hypothetical protein